MISRGVRNNNPFNIRISSNNWYGKLPSSERKDKEFEEFSSMIYGVRAGLILIKNYIKKHDCDTIEKIITRFAPPSENNTDNYILYVCGFLRNCFGREYTRTSHVKLFSDEYYGLCAAICFYESYYNISVSRLRSLSYMITARFKESSKEYV